MAWLINQNTDSLRYLPKIIATPECPEYATNAAYREQHGFIPNGIHAGGNAIEDRFWPTSGRFKNELKVVPRLLGLCSFYLIPESWHDVIEEFEPGVHQFKHIPLTLKDGSPLEERFYAMNIRQALTDAADRDRSTAPTKVYPDGRFVFLNTANRPQAHVYFRKSELQGFHLWCPREILIYDFAMSDELFDRISQLGGMETVRTLQIEEV